MDALIDQTHSQHMCSVIALALVHVLLLLMLWPLPEFQHRSARTDMNCNSTSVSFSGVKSDS